MYSYHYNNGYCESAVSILLYMSKNIDFLKNKNNYCDIR